MLEGSWITWNLSEGSEKDEVPIKGTLCLGQLCPKGKHKEDYKN